MADLGDQLKLQLEINKALKERQALLEKNAKVMSAQAQLSKKMCESLDCSGLKEMEESASGFTDTLSEGVQRNKDGLGDLNNLSETFSNRLKSIAKKAAGLAAITGAFKLMKGGVSLAIGALKGFFTAVTTVLSSLGKLAVSIISLPFDILNGMTAMAMRQGISPFRVALEELREEMGNFSSGPAADVVSAAKNIRKGFSDSSKSAVSFAKVYGYGRKGMANALKGFMELAKGVGPIFDSISGYMSKNAFALTTLSKGLGISGEAMGKFIQKNNAAGKDSVARLSEIGKMSKIVGKQFGISSKGISRMTIDMANSMEHFDGMSDAALVGLATHAKRTGIELKTLQGIVDKFDNFEDAARSAAMLRRQFGMFIDSRKMMSMDAAERQKYLRDQFAKTGKSFEGMDRLEKKALAKSLGMGMSEAQNIFGKASMTKKLTDSQKAANAAQRVQISQNKLLKELTKDIKKTLEEGPQYKTFMDAFVGGLQRGMYWSPQFQGVMVNLRAAMYKVAAAGRVIGRSFMKNFPGVEKMLGTVADFFSPGNIDKHLGKVTGLFDKFFKMLKTDPKNASVAVENLLGGLESAFTNFFGSAKGGAFAKGLDSFVTAIGNIGLAVAAKGIELASHLIEGLTSGLSFLLNGGDTGLSNAADAAAEGFADRFGVGLSKIKESFEKNMMPALEKAYPVIKEGVLRLWEPISAGLKELWDKNEFYVIGGMTALIFGPAVVGAILTAAIPAMALALKALIIKGFAAFSMTTVGTAIGVWALNVGGAITAGIAGVGAAAAAGVAALAGSIVYGLFGGFSEAWDGFSSGDGIARIAGKFVMGLAGGITEALSFGFFDADAMMDSVFGGTRALDNILEDQRKKEKAAIDKFRAEIGPERDKLKKLITDPKQFKEFEKEQEQAVAIQAAFKASMKKARGKFIDSDLEMAVVDLSSGMQRKLQMALKKGLTAEEQKMITMEGGLLKIDDDLYQKKGKHLNAVIASLGGKSAYEEKIKTLEGKAKEAQSTANEAAAKAAGTFNMMDNLTSYADLLPSSAAEAQLTEVQKQAQKLGELEAARNTLRKIKELTKVPEELKAAQKSFDGIKMSNIKTSIENVFTKVVEMSKHITAAINKPELKNQKAVINDSTMKNFDSIKKVRESIDAVIGKRTIGIKTVNARKQNITAGITALSEITIALGALGETAALVNLAGGSEILQTIAASTQQIVGESGIFDQQMSGLSKKIKGTRAAVTELNELAKALTETPELVAAINLGEKFTSGQDIQVEIKKTQINLRVNVQLDAKKFVSEIIDVEVDKKGEPGKQKIATTSLVKSR